MTAIERNWYNLIRDGHKTIDDVPRRIRETVKAELIKDGIITE